jgi:hypothetical protein
VRVQNESETEFYVWEVDDAGATAIHFRQPVGDAFGFELLPDPPVLPF